MPDVTEQRATRKRLPKAVAVIDASGCSGCGVCMEFCPADCIVRLPGPIEPTVNAVCVVDLTRCTGCTLCAKECPWDTIRMVPYGEVIRLKLVPDTE